METTTKSRDRDYSMNAVRLDGGKVHAIRRSGLTSYRVTYCTGRAISMMVGTTEAPTCESCLNKLARDLATQEGR